MHYPTFLTYLLHLGVQVNHRRCINVGFCWQWHILWVRNLYVYALTDDWKPSIGWSFDNYDDSYSLQPMRKRREADAKRSLFFRPSWRDLPFRSDTLVCISLILCCSALNICITYFIWHLYHLHSFSKFVKCHVKIPSRRHLWAIGALSGGKIQSLGCYKMLQKELQLCVWVWTLNVSFFK